jgi:hypothetical protein
MLSLTTETGEGGRVLQSWVICECTAGGLRSRLGPAQHESVSTAEVVRAAAQAVYHHPSTGPRRVRSCHVPRNVSRICIAL